MLSHVPMSKFHLHGNVCTTYSYTCAFALVLEGELFQLHILLACFSEKELQ